MLTRLILFSFLFACHQCILLNREQLASWYPAYSNSTILELQFRQISSISEDALSNLTNLNKLNIYINQLDYLHNRQKARKGDFVLQSLISSFFYFLIIFVL